MDVKDLREKTLPELDLELVALRKEMFALNIQRATAQLSDSSRFSKIRKTIARIKTIKHERQVMDDNS